MRTTIAFAGAETLPQTRTQGVGWPADVEGPAVWFLNQDNPKHIPKPPLNIYKVKSNGFCGELICLVIVCTQVCLFP